MTSALKAQGRLVIPVVGALVLSLAAAGAVAAQDTVVLPELPFTAKIGVGARAAGMGFANAAVAEDGSSLFYNPAGLAQIKRIELSGGLFHDSQDRRIGFGTASDGFPGTGPSSRTTGISGTDFGHLSFCYPFPTYRGSLVMGLAYQRVTSLRSDYFRQGYLKAPSPSGDGLLESESFPESGGVNYWTAGLGGDVSPNLSLGASLTFIQGKSRQDFDIGRFRVRPGQPPDLDDSDQVFRSIDNRDADLTGVTGSVGALARMSQKVRLGLKIDFPQRYDFDGTVSSTFEDQEKIDRSNFDFTDKITLPFSFVGGVAVTPRDFLLAADVRLTDWTEIDFNGPIQASDRRNAYRATVDVSLGAEYQLPFHPTRVRAGFSRQPLPYKLIPGDIDFKFVADDGNPNTTTDASSFTRLYPTAEITTDRRFLTLGAGTLVDNSLTLDLAYVHGIYERSGGSMSEKWTTNQIYGSATFRF